jgi:molybdopterin-containing oxidoreductase family iron-sulfur binding subunit
MKKEKYLDKKELDRRNFLKIGGAVMAGTALSYGLPLLSAPKLHASGEEEVLTGKRWGMVVDAGKCVAGCTACTQACRKENNVAFHGRADIDIHWIRIATIHRKVPGAKLITAPLMCNHCDNPPCALVCPVKATYKRDDGIVIVDKHRCIGCRYCLIACPYNMRMFNFKENHEWPNKELPKRMHGVSESCDFCYPRVDKGLLPVCVEACKASGHGALTFGNINDPKSDAALLIANNPVHGLREDLGTKPKVYYIGL